MKRAQIYDVREHRGVQTIQSISGVNRSQRAFPRDGHLLSGHCPLEIGCISSRNLLLDMVTIIGLVFKKLSNGLKRFTANTKDSCYKA